MRRWEILIWKSPGFWKQFHIAKRFGKYKPFLHETWIGPVCYRLWRDPRSRSSTSKSIIFVGKPFIIGSSSFEECPYCEAQVPSPEFSGRGGGRCPACEEWCSAYEIAGVTKWYKYPLPWDVYFAAFEENLED